MLQRIVTIACRRSVCLYIQECVEISGYLVDITAGGTMTFKRREMASALEARTKFPQLVTGEEKRVRFVVVHGLELVERPNMPPEDAEWYVISLPNYTCSSGVRVMPRIGVTEPQTNYPG